MIVVLHQILFVTSITHILAAENDSPIIGIAAQELKPSLRKLYPDHSSFIAASYVKAVESSGARVVPILPNKKESYYRNLLGSVNGVLLPGGATTLGPGNPYYDAVTKIYKIATQMNKKGLVFPILGVCLGYEFLITVANRHESFLVNCDVNYENLPIRFALPPLITMLYSDADEKVLGILYFTNVTVNHHRFCALEENFKNSSLINNWLVTSLSTSAKNGVEFIASVEHYSFPYFGVQFHPEKNSFEWDPTKHFPHSREAVIASRHFYDTLTKFSQMNNNTFGSTEKEKRSLIYNYPSTIDDSGEYEQIYLFN